MQVMTFYFTNEFNHKTFTRNEESKPEWYNRLYGAIYIIQKRRSYNNAGGERSNKQVFTTCFPIIYICSFWKVRRVDVIKLQAVSEELVGIHGPGIFQVCVWLQRYYL